jgi:rhamnosyltransferase
MILHVIMTVVATKDIRSGYSALLALGQGLVLPTWPNGGWSITTELHFYLLLPLLLFLNKKSSGWLLLAIVLAFAYRVYFFITHGEVQSIAYWTILGRLDQFILGILGFQWSAFVRKKHVIAALTFSIFLSIYYWFNLSGGFYLTGGKYPSPSSLWIWLPTLEGIVAAILIAWYDTSFNHRKNWISKGLSKIGEYSYSIYLLHIYFVFFMADYIHQHLINLSSFYVAFPVSIVAFLTMLPIGFLSMKFIESPFLRYRKVYYAVTRSSESEKASAA